MSFGALIPRQDELPSDTGQRPQEHFMLFDSHFVRPVFAYAATGFVEMCLVRPADELPWWHHRSG